MRNPRTIIAAQSTAGNAAVSAMLREPGIPVQRATTLDQATIEARDNDAIQRVLMANPLLMAVWKWIETHPKITFVVSALGKGEAAVTNAVLPPDALTPGLITNDLEISLKLAPLNGDGHRSSPASLLEQISHEMILHLLPWARVMMYKEFQALDSDDKVGQYTPERVGLVYQVLGSSGDLTKQRGQQRLVRDIQGDTANKVQFAMTGRTGGNHSDIGLWLLHFQSLDALARQEKTPKEQAALVYEAIWKVLLPMKMTGDPDKAIVRNVDALPRCYDVLDMLLATYGPHSADPGSFQQTVDSIKAWLKAYGQEAEKAERSGYPAQYLDPANMNKDSKDELISQ